MTVNISGNHVQLPCIHVYMHVYAQTRTHKHLGPSDGGGSSGIRAISASRASRD